MSLVSLASTLVKTLTPSFLNGWSACFTSSVGTVSLPRSVAFTLSPASHARNPRFSSASMTSFWIDVLVRLMPYEFQLDIICGYRGSFYINRTVWGRYESGYGYVLAGFLVFLELGIVGSVGVGFYLRGCVSVVL